MTACSFSSGGASEKIILGGTHSAFAPWRSSSISTTNLAFLASSSSIITTQTAHENKSEVDSSTRVFKTINSSCIDLSSSVTKVVLTGCEDRRLLSTKGEAISFSHAPALSEIELCKCLVLKVIGGSLPKTVKIFTVGHCDNCRKEVVNISFRLGLQGFELSNFSSSISSSQSAPAIYARTAEAIEETVKT